MIKETHISTTEDIKELLKEIAEYEQRKMRTVLARIVKEAHKEVFGERDNRTKPLFKV